MNKNMKDLNLSILNLFSTYSQRHELGIDEFYAALEAFNNELEDVIDARIKAREQQHGVGEPGK